VLSKISTWLASVFIHSSLCMVIELVFGSEGRTCLCDFQTTALRCFWMWHRIVWWTHQIFRLSCYHHLHSVVVYLFYPEVGGSRFFRNMGTVTKIRGISSHKGVTGTRRHTNLHATSVYTKVCVTRWWAIRCNYVPPNVVPWVTMSSYKPMMTGGGGGV